MGGRSTPFQKIEKNDFLTKVGEEGGYKTYLHNLVLNLAQPRNCLSVCTPDPQKVIRIIEKVNSKPKMSLFLSKVLGEGGQHDQHFVNNKFVKNRVGGREANINSDNVFKYTGFFFRVPLTYS